MQKHQESLNNIINSAKQPDENSHLIKLNNLKLLPVKSFSNLPTAKSTNSVTRRIQLNSKVSEKQILNKHKEYVLQRSSPPKLPPLQSVLNRSIKRFYQFSMPSSSLIEEMFRVKQKVPSFFHCSQGLINLEKPAGYENKKTLVLDLDETLIHADQDVSACHITVQICKNSLIGVNIRPYAQDLLKFVSGEYEVIIFTASNKKYADAIINHLDPQGIYVHHRLYREHCSEFQGNYLKNIERLANRNLKDIVIVDNSLVSFCMHIENGVPISSWYSDLRDIQLKILMDYLKVLLSVSDIRVLNQKFFGLKKSKNI